jgi:hypothetical protein
MPRAAPPMQSPTKSAVYWCRLRESDARIAASLRTRVGGWRELGVPRFIPACTGNVTGHSDKVGSAEAHERLSERRARRSWWCAPIREAAPAR